MIKHKAISWNLLEFRDSNDVGVLLSIHIANLNLCTPLHDHSKPWNHALLYSNETHTVFRGISRARVGTS